MGELDGTTAVITGASKNIGRAISVAYAEAGADLLLVARGAGDLAAVAEEIRASHPDRRVETLTADVGTRGGTEAVVEAARTSYDSIDILVNNAYSSGARGKTLMETSDDDWGDVLDVNLLGPFRLCRDLGSRMRDAGSGSIINVVSGSGFLPSPHLAPYGVSKAAMWMLTRYLAVQLAPTVRVNALCPGLVNEDGQPRSVAQADLLPVVPMGRVGKPEEITGAAVYLASPKNTYTTGSVVVVNGGRNW